MRFRDLLKREMENEDLSFRDLSRLLDNIPVPCLHDYVTRGTEPRYAQLLKMSKYFEEPISQLLSEDDDLTAELIKTVRTLDADRKQALLDALKSEIKTS